jgi:hypothetical protein
MTISLSGYYQVEITDSNGCIAISDSLFEIATTIFNQNTNGILVYSQSKSVWILMDNLPAGGYAYTLFNSIGQSLDEEKISATSVHFNYENLSEEIYFVELRNQYKQLSFKVLLVEN